MRAVLAGLLAVGVEDISIKATTTEQMGFVGRGEGIVAYAVVLLEKE
jgi:2-C-methyl-D-erythritol 2,4-cyclodiphosphate synthase